MGKAIETLSGALMLIALAAWFFWLKPMREDNARVNEQCKSAVMAELSKERLGGLAHVAGQIGLDDRSAGRQRKLLNVYVGSPPPNPPLERDSFFNAHALCDVDRYGIVGVSIRRGSLGASGFSPN